MLTRPNGWGQSCIPVHAKGEPMNVSEVILTKVFPLLKEHTYDGVLTTFVAVGQGKTVRISQIEDQPLCIVVYTVEANTVEELQGVKAVKSVELDRPMPTGEGLHLLALDFLAD
jgi:hypothetical protein